VGNLKIDGVVAPSLYTVVAMVDAFVITHIPVILELTRYSQLIEITGFPLNPALE
jgi:hypothetical protein